MLSARSALQFYWGVTSLISSDRDSHLSWIYDYIYGSLWSHAWHVMDREDRSRWRIKKMRDSIATWQERQRFLWWIGSIITPVQLGGLRCPIKGRPEKFPASIPSIARPPSKLVWFIAGKSGISHREMERERITPPRKSTFILCIKINWIRITFRCKKQYSPIFLLIE